MAASSTVGQKRQRTESSPSSGMDSNARTRDAEFWFEDGNVILVARAYEFRVFKGILSHHSPVFQDMFSFPQPVPSAQPESSRAATEADDACPVVHLSDSPEDLRHVLRVCMPRSDSRFIPFPQDNPSFDAVSALIRLGHKYQMQALVAQVVQYLKIWFTDDFDTWSTGKIHHVDTPIRARHAIGVVNLARLVDEPALLPTALLMCCALNGNIVKGYTRDDGTQEMLALDDIGRCFSARAHMAGQSLLLATQIFRPCVLDSECCVSPEACVDAVQDMLLGVGDDMLHYSHPDVFTSWLKPYDNTASLRRCCTSCRRMLEDRDRKLRMEVWSDLPGIMGVDVDGWATGIP